MPRVTGVVVRRSGLGRLVCDLDYLEEGGDHDQSADAQVSVLMRERRIGQFSDPDRSPDKHGRGSHELHGLDPDARVAQDARIVQRHEAGVSTSQPHQCAVEHQLLGRRGQGVRSKSGHHDMS